MKRRPPLLMILLLLLACGVAGAIVNIAVAWGCGVAATRVNATRQSIAFAAGGPSEHWLMDGERTNGWQRIVWSPPNRPHASKMTITINGVQKPPPPTRLLVPPKWSRFDWQSSPASGPYAAVEDACGWPLLAVASCTMASDAETLSSDGIVVAGDPLNTYLGGIMGIVPLDLRVLPLLPLWPGFAINTVFYAFVLWPLFAAPFALWGVRRRRRIKRGLCPKCAYPVGTNERCTECGTPIMQEATKNLDANAS